MIFKYENCRYAQAVLSVRRGDPELIEKRVMKRLAKPLAKQKITLTEVHVEDATCNLYMVASHEDFGVPPEARKDYNSFHEWADSDQSLNTDNAFLKALSDSGIIFPHEGWALGWVSVDDFAICVTYSL